MQENKPVLELKNTGKKVYQKLKLKKSFFHCALITISIMMMVIVMSMSITMMVIIMSISMMMVCGIRKSISCISRGSLGIGSSICYSIFQQWSTWKQQYIAFLKKFFQNILWLCLLIVERRFVCISCYCEMFSHANRD